MLKSLKFYQRSVVNSRGYHICGSYSVVRYERLTPPKKLNPTNQFDCLKYFEIILLLRLLIIIRTQLNGNRVVVWMWLLTIYVMRMFCLSFYEFSFVLIQIEFCNVIIIVFDFQEFGILDAIILPINNCNNANMLNMLNIVDGGCDVWDNVIFRSRFSVGNSSRID